MNWKTISVLSLISISLMGCGPRIPILGIDDSGKQFEQWIPANDYSKNMGNLLSSVNESVIPTLATLDEKSEWAVRTVAVGILVSGDVGIAGLRVGAMGRFRVAYSNSSDPALP